MPSNAAIGEAECKGKIASFVTDINAKRARWRISCNTGLLNVVKPHSFKASLFSDQILDPASIA